MIDQLYTALIAHFSARDDIADAMMGPEREDWFNAEAICAIGKDRAHFGNWWIYGEMSYNHWCETCHVDPAFVAGFGGCEPDLFCVERKTDNIKLIGEGKLVRRSTDNMPFGDGDDSLLVQLNRARLFAGKLPAPVQVCGLIYGLYNPANMFVDAGTPDPNTPGLYTREKFKTASPGSYFDWIRDRWTSQHGVNEWRFWRGGMQRSPALQKLTPKYANLASSLELGIGILLHKDDPLLRMQ